MMDSDQILNGINDDDVINFTKPHEKKTFCISDFRTIIKTAAVAMKDAYANSLRNQRYLLHTSEIDESDYNGWLADSGIECKLLRLGDSQWKSGKIRVRIGVEFIPDDEEDSNEVDEPSLDTFRENS